MNARALVVAILLVGCSASNTSHRQDAAPPRSASTGRMPELCTRTGQRPGLHATSTRDVPENWTQGIPDTFGYMVQETTVRMLSVVPLRFQIVDAGARHHIADLLDMGPVRIGQHTAALVAGLPFGAVVEARFHVPPIGDAEPRPAVLLDVKRASREAAVPPLLAEWRHVAGFIKVYADGHAIVLADGEVVDAPLSDAELNRFLEAFATVDFDALPEANQDQTEYVALACQRYQRVLVADHERALAPVMAAFARVGEQALARLQPVLRIHSKMPVQIVAWPADAPPLADLDRLQENHWKRAEAGAPIDHGSQLFRTVPRSIMEAPADGEQRLATYDEDGALWIIYREACGAESRACRPGTYCIIRVSRMPWKKAPDWAPDFSRIGEQGLFLTGKDPRWQSLVVKPQPDVYPDEYLQNGVIYAVVLDRRDPGWPR